MDPVLHVPLSARRGPLPALGSHGPTSTSSSRSPTADHRRRRCAPSLKPIRHHRRPRDDHCNRCRRLRPRRRVALASVTAIAAIHSTALVAASSLCLSAPTSLFRLASKAPIATTAIAATACVATFNRPFANPSPPLSPSPPSPPPSPRCRPHHCLPMPAPVTAASILAPPSPPALPDVQWACKAIGHICARAPACPPRAQHPPCSCTRALALLPGPQPAQHASPFRIHFLAGLNVSFPTRCGRWCGMPILLEKLRPGPADSTHLWTSTPVGLNPPPRPRERTRRGCSCKRPRSLYFEAV